MINTIEHFKTRLRMRHLQLLNLLSSVDSLRKASEEMCLTQPAVTKMLQELELVIGEPLFQRTSQGLKANVLGETAINYAQLVFADLESFHCELRALQTGALGNIRIGSMGSLAGSLLPDAINRLKTSHPRLGISVVVETSDILLQLLARGEIDLAVARVPTGWSQEEFQLEEFGEEKIEVVGCKDHPRMATSNVTLLDLMEYSWVVQPQPTPLREIFNQIFRESQIGSPVSLVETSSTTLTFSLVQQTDMITLMPRSLLKFYKGIGILNAFDISLHVHLSQYGIIRRRNRFPSPSVLIASDALRAAYAKVRDINECEGR